jgi:hypothetical protein
MIVCGKAMIHLLDNPTINVINALQQQQQHINYTRGSTAQISANQYLTKAHCKKINLK